MKEEEMIMNDEEEKPVIMDAVGVLRLMSWFNLKGPIFPYPENVELETGA